MKPLEHELELTTRAVLAAENWAAAYSNAPQQHAELIRLTAKMQLQVMRYLRGLAKEAPSLVNWYHYSAAVAEQQHAFLADSIQAYNIDIVINNDAVSQQDQAFIKIVFDTVATVVATGASSMEAEHGAPIGLSSTSSIIQNLTTKQLANLVGMRVQKDGTIIPNPKPEYNIDETTRTRIAQSVKTSIQLGEDHTQAVKRLKSVIADADRADMIAYTETVRAYAEGRKAYGLQSGASYKVWSDNNAVDVCADNTAQGPIAIGDTFVSGDDNEPAHPHCLVGGTVVSSTAIRATSKRVYKGRVVTIRTARGNELTVTPNHPVLTAQGWIAAGKVHEGMNLLSCRNAERVTSSVNPDDHNIPAKVEQVIESFERALAVMSVAMPTTTKDFHGDGIDGEVAVINSNRFLRNGVNGKSILEPFSKQELGRANMRQFGFSSIGMFYQLFKRQFTTACSLIRGLCPQLALLGSSPSDTLPIGLRHGSQFDVSLAENAIDYNATDPRLASKLLDRFARDVAFDEVVSIEVSNFEGHVYNLETNEGWYIANGIITHNCKCLVTYLYADSVEEAKSQWES